MHVRQDPLSSGRYLCHADGHKLRALCGDGEARAMSSLQLIVVFRRRAGWKDGWLSGRCLDRVADCLVMFRSGLASPPPEYRCRHADAGSSGGSRRRGIRRRVLCLAEVLAGVLVSCAVAAVVLGLAGRGRSVTFVPTRGTPAERPQATAPSGANPVPRLRPSPDPLPSPTASWFSPSGTAGAPAAGHGAAAPASGTSSAVPRPVHPARSQTPVMPTPPGSPTATGSSSTSSTPAPASSGSP